MLVRLSDPMVTSLIDLNHRRSGVLLHISSLPSRYGIGDLGPNAHSFVSRLAEANQRLWQVLPLVPLGYGYSPYQSPSTFAGNSLFISPALLYEAGLVDDVDLARAEVPDSNYVSFEEVARKKEQLFEIAWRNFKVGSFDELSLSFAEFQERNDFWLADYSLFAAIKESQELRPWYEWPVPLANKEPAAVFAFKESAGERIEYHQFVQFLFFRQWNQLHQHARANNVGIIGDVPIYVAHDSADVWSNRHLFFLDDDGKCTVVAGVPPDYFSETGQRWGNPLYRWDVHASDGYEWWVQRFRAILNIVDGIRIDHFRGFEAYWEIPGDQPTAVNGQWVPGPRYQLFDTIERRLGKLPIIAEDLGVITQGVVDLIERYNFPGMAILQFGFDSGPAAKFLPHNYNRNLVAYTGTHDNDSVLGWYYNMNSTQSVEVEERARDFARRYLAIDLFEEGQVHWSFIRAILQSPANLAIIPMQDLLGLGSESRMNTPGTDTGNWVWRLNQGQFETLKLDTLAELTYLFNRAW